MNESFAVKNNVYITVIGKNLDFIYSSRNKINALQNSGNDLNEGYVSPADNKINVAFRITDLDEEGNEIPVPDETFNSLKADGNLVFIHPDT